MNTLIDNYYNNRDYLSIEFLKTFMCILFIMSMIYIIINIYQ